LFNKNLNLDLNDLISVKPTRNAIIFAQNPGIV